MQSKPQRIPLNGGLNNIPSCHEFIFKKIVHWSPHDSYYWHMYSNFSHCLGYLAKTSQFWITGIHGIGWHHARKPYEPTISRGRSLSRIGSPLIGSGERRQLILTFLLWVNPDKINQKPRHSLSAQTHWVIPLRLCSRIELPTHPKCSWI